MKLPRIDFLSRGLRANIVNSVMTAVMMAVMTVVITVVMTVTLTPIFDLSAYADDVRDASEYERSIIHLMVTKATPDPEAPWSLQNSDGSGYAGVVIAPDKVLTQASLVSRAVYIQAQRVDDVEKIPMRIVFADYEANLAVLAPVAGATLGGVKPLLVGPDLPIGSDVWMIAIENERQLQRLEFRSMQVGLREANIGGMTLPIYSLSGQARTACKADPVLRKGMLAGLCVGVVENQPQILTAGVISHFLADSLTAEKYKGFGSYGITLHQVKSPWQRKLLGLPSGKGALRVAVVQDISPFADCIHVDDIVTAVDEIPVDHRGFYRHPQWGGVPIRHYVITKYAGDQLTVHVSRAGKAESCTRILRRYSSLDAVIPGLTSEGPVPHLIFGGLVFRELSADFLAGYGHDWTKTAPAAFAFIYSHLNEPSLIRRRQVLLSNVLADPFNEGYEKISNLVLESVNGRSAGSIEELRNILKLPGVQRDGVEFAQFDFKDGTEVVIPYQGLLDAQIRIGQMYGVTSSLSFFSR